jgi:large subunit ribosomal protein L21
MYAIIRAGGKQAKVRSGDVIEVERMKNAGDTVEFSPLLVVDESGVTYGTADLAGAKVTAKVLGEVKGDKVHIFKYKNKTGYRRRAGHRQTYTRLEISDISLGTASPAEAEAAASEEE